MDPTTPTPVPIDEPTSDAASPGVAPAPAAAASTTPRSADLELLTTYLAAHDVPCPRCAYNLRGVELDVCPECGESLSLKLSRESTIGLRDGDYRLFFLIGFGWPCLAGIMNTTRTLRQAHAVASYYNLRSSIFRSWWDTMDWGTWLRLGWSVYLTVAGLIGLIVVWRHWSRPCTYDRRSKLTQTCLFVFGVYLAWHVVWFFIELA